MTNHAGVLDEKGLTAAKERAGEAYMQASDDEAFDASIRAAVAAYLAAVSPDTGAEALPTQDRLGEQRG